jgi:hypothetical protein
MCIKTDTHADVEFLTIVICYLLQFLNMVGCREGYRTILLMAWKRMRPMWMKTHTHADINSHNCDLLIPQSLQMVGCCEGCRTMMVMLWKRTRPMCMKMRTGTE